MCFSSNNETDLVCQRLQCPTNDIDCILNTTKSIQYQFLSLPSIYDLPHPAVLTKVQTLGHSVFPNLRFIIEDGNERGYFDVVNDIHHPDRGKFVFSTLCFCK